MKRAFICLFLLTACGARTGVGDATDDAGLAISPADAGHRDAGAGVDGGAPCDEPPICGGRPCTGFVDDQEVFALPSPTNDVPTITLDERGEIAILVPATGGGGYVGYLVRWIDRSFSSSRIAPPTATGALATGAPGALLLHAYDGAYGNELWTERGGMLVSLGVVPTDAIVQAGGLVRDGIGALHFLGEAGTGRDSSFGPTYLRRDASGEFSTTLLPDVPMGVRGGAITVDGDLTPWIVWRARADGPTGQVVRAWSGTGGAETLLTTILFFEGDSAALRVAAAGTTIWLAYVGGGSLMLARRSSFGLWPMAASALALPSDCGAAAPCQPLVPLGVVADCDGTASAFYARPGDALGDGVVHMETMDSTSRVGSTPVMLSRAAVMGGTVVRDAAGDVHVAYLVQDEVRRLSVRYGRWTASP